MQDKWDLKTYCEILGVSENSPQHIIHAAYLNARKTYSLDNPEVSNSFSRAEAQELERLVEEAFAVLGNYSMRAFYQRKNQASPKQINPKPNGLSPVKTKLPNGIRTTSISTYQVDRSFEKEIVQAQVFDGEFLKKIRKYKCISVEQMSRATKIKSTYIESIEDNDFDTLPAPVYTRGFIIQISKILDLPAEEVASSYMCQYKSPYEPRI